LKITRCDVAYVIIFLISPVLQSFDFLYSKLIIKLTERLFDV